MGGNKGRDGEKEMEGGNGTVERGRRWKMEWKEKRKVKGEREWMVKRKWSVMEGMVGWEWKAKKEEMGKKE